LGIWGIKSFLPTGPLDWKSSLIRQVVLTIKEKPRDRSKAIAAIWASMLALVALRILGLSRIWMSSLRVLLARSEAERIFLIFLYRFEPRGISTISRGCSLTYMCLENPVEASQKSRHP